MRQRWTLPLWLYVRLPAWSCTDAVSDVIVLIAALREMSAFTSSTYRWRLGFLEDEDHLDGGLVEACFFAVISCDDESDRPRLGPRVSAGNPRSSPPEGLDSSLEYFLRLPLSSNSTKPSDLDIVGQDEVHLSSLAVWRPCWVAFAHHLLESLHGGLVGRLVLDLHGDGPPLTGQRADGVPDSTHFRRAARIFTPRRLRGPSRLSWRPGRARL